MGGGEAATRAGGRVPRRPAPSARSVGIVRIAINGSAATLSGRLEDVLDAARAARADGFGSFWLAQTTLLDALAVLAVAGASGAAPAEVGTAVVATYGRHPTVLAAQALTAQAALPGRLVLGVGVSHRPSVEERLRMRWDPPLRHVREYLTILDALLREGRADHHGELFSAHVDQPRPPVEPPSVMLAALGPQMLRLAGERTDGTVLWMVGPRTIREHVAPTIGDAAARAGRPAPRIVCSLPVVVTDREAEVRAFAARAFARYGELPSYRAMLDREGAEGPQDVCIVGDEQAVGAALDEIARAGATDFAAVEIGGTPEECERTRALLRARI